MPIDDRTRDWFADRYWADDDALMRARDAFAETGPLIEVPAETGALLATLVRAIAAERVLEVGTLFGYSAVWMARALPQHGHLDTLEIVDAHADAAEQLLCDAGVEHLVTVHRGAAAETLARLQGPYDLAFIDADKVGYPGYVDHAVRLVRPGGLILCDNVAQGGRVADPTNSEPAVTAIRSVHELIADHPELHSNVLPVGDGVSVSVRR